MALENPGFGVFIWSRSAHDASHQRSPHSKKKSGCYNCRERHQRCDEEWPTCRRCRRLQKPCHRPITTHGICTSERDEQFAVLTTAQMYHASLPDPSDVTAFEYFHIMCLPVLRMSPTSTIWDKEISFQIQTSSAIRKTVIALGCQLRSLSESGTDGLSDCVSVQVEKSYRNAVQAWRRSITARSKNDGLTVPLGCALFVMLETLRNAPAEMTMHLRSGIRIIAEIDRAAWDIDGMRDISLLFHDYAVNSWLYACSPSHRGDYADNFAHDTVLTFQVDSAKMHCSWFEHSSIVSETIQTRYAIAERTMSEEDSKYKLDSLRVRNRKLREELNHPVSLGARVGIVSKIIEAGTELSEIMLNSRRNDDASDVEWRSKAFGHIVDLVESFLAELNSTISQSPNRPCAFSTGLGTIQILDLVITQCSSMVVRRRALALLDCCPEREGMWVAKDVKNVCSQLLCEEDDAVEMHGAKIK